VTFKPASTHAEMTISPAECMEDSPMLRTTTRWLRSGRVWIGAVALAALACGDAPSPVKRETAVATPIPAAPTPANQPPRIRSIVLEPSVARAGDSVTLVLDASDPDGDPLRTEVAWRIDGEPVGEGQMLVIPEHSRDGRLEAEVTLSDGVGGEVVDRASLFVENSPPAVVAIAFEPETPTVESPLAFEARGADPDGDTLRFQVEWWVDDSKLAFTGESLPPSFFERGSRITAEVRAHDGNVLGPALRSQTITVANATPRFTSSPTDLSGETTLRKTLRAEDPDGDRRLRFRLVDGPDGLEVDAVTGEIAWTPSAEQAGNHRVVVEVEDGAGGSASQEFELSVGASAPASLP
jgi:hypothetical protein